MKYKVVFRGAAGTEALVLDLNPRNGKAFQEDGNFTHFYDGTTTLAAIPTIAIITITKED